MSTTTNTGPLADLLSLADTFSERATTAEIAQLAATSPEDAYYYAGQGRGYRQAAEQLRAALVGTRHIVRAVLDELTSSVATEPA